MKHNVIFNLLSIAIGAAGMLKLLVSKQAYEACDGGATLLTGQVMMEWWQVIFQNKYLER
jgi:hypothetical protein